MVKSVERENIRKMQVAAGGPRPGGIGKLGRAWGGDIGAPGLTRGRFLPRGLGYACSAAPEVTRREARRAQARRTIRPNAFGPSCAGSDATNPECPRPWAPPPLPCWRSLTLPPSHPQLCRQVGRCLTSELLLQIPGFQNVVSSSPVLGAIYTSKLVATNRVSFNPGWLPSPVIPASTFGMLGLQACTTTLAFTTYRIEHRAV